MSIAEYTHCTWAGVTFLRQRKKVPLAHVQQVYLEKPIGYPAHTRLISLSVRPSVCPSVRPIVWNTKTRRIFTQELKLGCPREVFCPLSVPPEYLFQSTRRKFGFNKKICRNLLIVYVYYQPNGHGYLFDFGQAWFFLQHIQNLPLKLSAFW